MRLLPVLIACCICGCAPKQDAPKSCVLITLDTTNPDALDVYGDKRGLTPNLNRLASEGIVFEDARAVAPITIASHASMLTGLYPPRHGVRDNGYMSLPSSAETLAERAKDAGCRTGAFVAAGVLRELYGLNQGFDVYGESPAVSAHRGGVGDRIGTEVSAEAIEWLNGRDGEEPFFLWVHYFDPHAPYEAPAEFLKRAEGKPYLGEVAAMDAAIGPLLDRLRAEPDYEDFCVIVVADHGESGGKHGEATHGLFCYDATLKVPLIVRLPGQARARGRSTERVSIVDVFPTALEAMGLSVPESDGLSLVAGDITADRGVYFESYYGYLNYGWGHLAGWVGPGGQKYIHGPTPELYDTASDPEETSDLLVRNPFGIYKDSDGSLHEGGVVSAAREAMMRIAQAPALERTSSEEGAVSQEGMRGMGYAGSASVSVDLPEPASPSTLPSPAGNLDEHYAVWSALAQSDRGKVDLAIAGLQQVVAKNPRHSFAHSLLGEMLLEVKKPRKAIAVLSAMIELELDRPGLRRNLALAHAMLGEYKLALEHARAFEEFCPGDPQAAEFRRNIEKRQAELKSQRRGGN